MSVTLHYLLNKQIKYFMSSVLEWEKVIWGSDFFLLNYKFIYRLSLDKDLALRRILLILEGQFVYSHPVHVLRQLFAVTVYFVKVRQISARL